MILVTGPGGVVGRPLVAALQASGGEPVRAVHSSEVDLRDWAATADLFESVKPRVVYHLAAKVHGLGGNAAFPAEMFTDNIRINTNVVDAARRASCEKVVAVSTVAAYNAELPKPVREEMIWSGPPHGAEAAYGHAKRAMLAQLEACAAQYGLHYAYAILTNVYGPHDRFDPIHGHVVPSLVAKFHTAATKGGPVVIWGTGRAERDFLYGEDAADALLVIGDRAQGAINVATGRAFPIRHVVETLCEVSGVKDVVWDSSRPDGQLERSYDVERLRNLDFKPRVDLVEGLWRTYSWYAENNTQVRL